MPEAVVTCTTFIGTMSSWAVPFNADPATADPATVVVLPATEVARAVPATVAAVQAALAVGTPATAAVAPATAAAGAPPTTGAGAVAATPAPAPEGAAASPRRHSPRSTETTAMVAPVDLDHPTAARPAPAEVATTHSIATPTTAVVCTARPDLAHVVATVHPLAQASDLPGHPA